MTNEEIYKKVDDYTKQHLSSISFDKALPVMQKYLQEVADECGITGADVFKIYMDIRSKEKK